MPTRFFFIKKKHVSIEKETLSYLVALQHAKAMDKCNELWSL